MAFLDNYFMQFEATVLLLHRASQLVVINVFVEFNFFQLRDHTIIQHDPSDNTGHNRPQI